MQEALNPATVMVDWQYSIKKAPIPTLVSLKDNRRDAMGAPWFENYSAHVKTIVQCGLFGIMMTTWHTLNEKMESILGCAKTFRAITFPWSDRRDRLETAVMLRRISFEGNNYETSGWTRKDIVDHFMK